MAGGGIKVNNITVSGGADGKTPVFKIEDGKLFNSYNNGVSWYELGQVKGADGKDGVDGVNGVDGEDGPRGLQGERGSTLIGMEFQGTDEQGGNVYLMTFSDGLTVEFTAPKGDDGSSGGGLTEEQVREIVAEETADLVAQDERDEFVKGGLTENEENWTDEEKASACETIGAVGKTQVSQAATPNAIVQRYSSGGIAVPLAPTAEVHATSKGYVDGKTDALSQDISVINIALEQSGLVKKYKQPIEQEYNERVTANGLNVLEGSKAVIKKVVGNTVASTNQLDLSKVDTTGKTIQIIDNGKTIIGVNYGSSLTSGLGKLKDICPKLNVGDTIYLYETSGKLSSGLVDSGYNTIIPLNTATVVTSDMFNTDLYLGVIPFVDGETVCTELQITKEQNASWQPYFTGLKSTSFAGIESGGKNILNQQLLSGGEFVTFNGKSCYKYADSTSSGFSFKAGFIKNQRYTITAKIYREESQVGNAVYLRVWYTDGTKQEVFFTPNVLKSFTTTANKTVDYIDSLPNYAQNAYLDLTVTQIEAGTVATEFSAYVEATFDFPKTATPLGTTIDFENKKITNYGVDLVLTGEETYGYISEYGKGVSIKFILKDIEIKAKGVFSDGEVYTTSGGKAGAIRIGISDQFVYWDGILDLLGFTTAGATPTDEEKTTAIANFKAWLAERYASGNPVTIRYVSSTLQSESTFTEGNEYTAYKGGTEKVLENDGNEYGADNTLTQDYILVTEVK